MESAEYQDVLECNVQPSVQKQCLCWWLWVFQQVNNPKNTAKAPWNGSRSITRLFGAASDDLDLNHTHNLWRELKTAHGGLPSNIEELEQFTAKKWDKLPVEKCSKVIDGYKKHLLAVLLANGCATKYQLWVANNFVHFLHVFIFENLIVNLSLQK